MNEFDWMRDLGLPGGIAALLGIVVKILLWIKPHAEKIIEAHLSLTKKLESNVDDQIAADATTHDKLDKIHRDVQTVVKQTSPPDCRTL